MRFGRKLKSLYVQLTQIDVISAFPEVIDEEFCYTEVAYQYMLEDIKTIQQNLALKLYDFWKIVGVVKDDETTAAFNKKTFQKTIKTMSEDPYIDTKSVTSAEFQRIIDNANSYTLSEYIDIIEFLTELAWKHEILGDNVVSLKNALAEACSKLYLDLTSNKIRAKRQAKRDFAEALQDDRKRSDAVIFGNTRPSRSFNLDVSRYDAVGALILMQAININYRAYQIAQAREDHIQAFRSFRKSARIRKRFGLTEVMIEYLINKELLMTKNSINQMNEKGDNLELRKFELQKRTQQQIRNLKRKSLIVED